MKRIPARLAALAMTGVIVGACATADTPTYRSGHITVAIEPNPIIATQASDGRWVFPFTVNITESGGANVAIREVRANVIAFGRLPVHQERMTAAEIRELGYPTEIRAGETRRIPLTIRRSVPDASLFESVQAEITIFATDETGREITASTSVRVRPA